jgi:hypothetical protein
MWHTFLFGENSPQAYKQMAVNTLFLRENPNLASQKFLNMLCHKKPSSAIVALYKYNIIAHGKHTIWRL